MSKKIYEMYENQLKLIKSSQAAAFRVVVSESQQKVDSNGQIINGKLSSEYLTALNELKDLINREQSLMKILNSIDPDLDSVCDEKYYFNDRGELKVL